jgi:hypothetical protein
MGNTEPESITIDAERGLRIHRKTPANPHKLLKSSLQRMSLYLNDPHIPQLLDLSQPPSPPSCTPILLQLTTEHPLPLPQTLTEHQALEMMIGLLSGVERLFEEVGGAFEVRREMVGVVGGRVVVWFHCDLSEDAPEFRMTPAGSVAVEEDRMVGQCYELAEESIFDRRFSQTLLSKRDQHLQRPWSFQPTREFLSTFL